MPGFLQCFVFVHSFILLNRIPPKFVYPFTKWRILQFFPLGVIMNKAAINIHIQVFCKHAFISLGYTPRRRTATL